MRPPDSRRAAPLTRQPRNDGPRPVPRLVPSAVAEPSQVRKRGQLSPNGPDSGDCRHRGSCLRPRTNRPGSAANGHDPTGVGGRYQGPRVRRRRVPARCRRDRRPVRRTYRRAHHPPVLVRYLRSLTGFERDARLFLFVTLASGSAVSLWWIDFNLYLRSLGIDPALIGLIATAGSAASLVVAFPASILSDRIGRRLALLGGAALMTAAFAGLLVTSALPALFLLAAAFSAGSGAMSVVAQPFLAEHSRAEERSELFAVQFAIGSGTNVAAALVGGFVAQLVAQVGGFDPQGPEAYRVLIALMAGMGLLAVVLLTWLRDDRPGTADGRRSGGRGRVGRVRWSGQVRLVRPIGRVGPIGRVRRIGRSPGQRIGRPTGRRIERSSRRSSSSQPSHRRPVRAPPRRDPRVRPARFRAAPAAGFPDLAGRGAGDPVPQRVHPGPIPPGARVAQRALRHHRPGHAGRHAHPARARPAVGQDRVGGAGAGGEHPVHRGARFLVDLLDGRDRDGGSQLADERGQPDLRGVRDGAGAARGAGNVLGGETRCCGRWAG